MGIYLQSAPIDKLIFQITCGDVGLEHAVVVPKPYFPTIKERLSDPNNFRIRKDGYFSWWDARTRFLTRRCEKGFLQDYLSEHLEIMERVAEPDLMLEADDSVALAVRLFDLGLLPEHVRKAFLETVEQYAISGEDGYGLRNPGIRKMFRRGEWKDFLERIRARLVPILGSARRDWERSYRSSDDPEEHMDGFSSILKSLETLFPDDPVVSSNVSREQRVVEEWIEDRKAAMDDPPSGPPPRIHSTGSSHEVPNPQKRSVFDDVDA
jgi:hypothetical protein